MSKAIDKAAGAEREVVAKGSPVKRMIPGADQNKTSSWIKDNGREFVPTETAPATEEAVRWQGWGTALKPAHEPIVVARKPLVGTVAANVLAHGTGALNIDGARLDAAPDPASWTAKRTPGDGGGRMAQKVKNIEAMNEGLIAPPSGRWPANLVLVHADGCKLVGTKRVRTSDPRRADGTTSGALGTNGVYGGGTREGMDKPFYADEDGREEVEAWECVEGCPVRTLDLQSGVREAGRFPGVQNEQPGTARTMGGGWNGAVAPERNLDAGGASRFFYTAKASRVEREAGLRGVVPCARCGGLDTVEHEVEGRVGACIRNDHPTVKPVDLMRWLVRLVTRPGGRVLDPFAGSGTTGVACAVEGFEFVGCEQDERSASIAETRIGYWSEHGEEALAMVRAERLAEAVRVERQAAGAEQLDLFAALAGGGE